MFTGKRVAGFVRIRTASFPDPGSLTTSATNPFLRPPATANHLLRPPALFDPRLRRHHLRDLPHVLSPQTQTRSNEQGVTVFRVPFDSTPQFCYKQEY